MIARRGREAAPTMFVEAGARERPGLFLLGTVPETQPA